MKSSESELTAPFLEDSRSMNIKRSIPARNILFLAIGLLAGLFIGLFFPGRVFNQIREKNELERTAFPVPSAKSLIAQSSGGDSSFGGYGEGNVGAFHEYISPDNSFDVRNHLGELPVDDKEAYIRYMLENSSEKEEYLDARWALSRRFIDSGELQGAALEGFLRTPREHFVRKKNLPRAYDDSWLPIGYGATITDPDVVAMMTTTLDVKPDHKVLEIGTGSGYQSAILSNISNHVYSIEIIKPLFFETNDLYKELTSDYPQYDNISRRLGDGYFGWERFAPFDRIIVTCSIDHLPPPLIKQLKPGGIMVVPLGNPSRQYIMEVKKTIDESGNVVLTRRDVYNGLWVKFIPFRDMEGKSYSGDRQSQ